MKLISYTIKHPVTISMLTLIVIVVGFVSYLSLQIDLMPDISFPIITIQTDYEGATPNEIETLITKRIEETVSGIENIDRLSSYSYEGRSLVRIYFKWGLDLDEVASDIRDRLSRVRSRLPEDANDPILLKFDINAIPIMWIGVQGNLSYKDLKHYTQKHIKNSFERIKGVAQAQVSGGLEREIHINLNYKLLQTQDISFGEVRKAIQNENKDITIGEIEKPTKRYLIRTPGKFTSIEEIKEVVVKRVNNTNVLIGDIGNVYDSFKEIKTFVRVNGENAVLLRLIKQSDANTVQTAESILKELKKLNESPSIKQRGVSLKVTRDTSVYIKRSINNVRLALIYGGFIALTVLLIFIRNIRATLIIAIAMFVSTISTFILMSSFDLTLNIMTFGGLALGVGMLVDNSVVVIENIVRHKDISGKEAGYTGTKEVIKAITTSTVTTLVVFMPLFFLEGISGIMFGQLALMVSFALLGSLLTSLTLIPAYSNYILYSKDTKGDNAYNANINILKALNLKMEGFLKRLSNMYIKGLYIILENKLKCVSVFVFFLLVGLFLLRFMGFNFMAETDEGEIRLNGNMAVGTNIETTNARFKKIETLLKDNFGNEIDVIYTRIGQSGWRRPQEHSGYSNIYLKGLDNRSKSSKDLSLDISKLITSKLKDIRLRVRPSNFFLFRYMRGGEDRIELQVLGHETEANSQLSDLIIKELSNIQGITYLKKSLDKSEPQYALRIDRRKAKEFGISLREAGEFLQNATLGNVVSYYSDGEDEYPIRVRISPEEIRNIGAIENLKYTMNNQKIYMKNLITDIREEPAPSVIERLNQQRVIYIQGGIGNRDTNHILNDIKKAMERVTIPKDTSIHYGGVFEEQEKALQELMLGIIMAFALVYMVMAGQFESFKAPFVIIFTVPFSFTGVILIFFLLNYSFDVQSFIGAIMLTGIVVNNAIVLVDFIERERAKEENKNKDLREIIIYAGEKRLRPILITSLTTILALIPLAIGLGEGSETQIPIALTVIGGLSYSIFVSLLLIPCIYFIIFKNVKNKI